MTSLKIKISIIIPIYNVEKYLEECIDSAINQTYRAYEIILVDDGSEDSSSLICDRYEQKYSEIKVIHKKNGGLSDARNAGLKQALGEWVYFIDADDYILPDTLEIFAKTIKNNKNLDFIHGSLCHFNNGENNLVSYKKYLDNKWAYGLSGQEAFVEAFKRKMPIMMGVHGLYKKDFLYNNDLFFKKGIYAEDEEWTVKVFHKAKHIAGTKKPCYCVRLNRPGSLTYKLSISKYLDLLDIYLEWEEIANDSSSTSEFKIILQDVVGRRARSTILSASRNLNRENGEIAYLKKIREYNRLFYYKTKYGTYKAKLLYIVILLFGPQTVYKMLKIFFQRKIYMIL